MWADVVAVVPKCLQTKFEGSVNPENAIFKYFKDIVPSSQIGVQPFIKFLAYAEQFAKDALPVDA